MGNNKIQTLRDLCLELKNKRELLKQHWQNTQHYLQVQQGQVNQELTTLRGNCREFSNEFHSLESDLSQLYQRRHMLPALPSTGRSSLDTAHYSQLNHEFQALQSDYSHLQSDFSGLQTELQQLNQDWQQTGGRQSQTMPDEMLQLRQRFLKQQKKLKLLYQKYIAQKELLGRLNSDSSERSRQLNQFGQELQALHLSSTDLKEEFTGVSEELSQLHVLWLKSTEERQIISEQLQRELEQVRQEADALGAQMVQLESGENQQNEILRTQVASLEAELAQKNEQIALSQEALLQNTNSTRQGTEELTHLRDLHQQLQQELDGLKEELNGLNQELNGKSQELDGLKEELNGKNQELDGLKEELNGLNQELNGKSDGLNGLKEELNGLTQELNGLKDELAGKNQELAGKNQELTELKEETADIREEYERLQAQATVLQQDLAAVKESDHDLQSSLAQQQEKLAQYQQGFDFLQNARLRLQEELQQQQQQVTGLSQEESVLLQQHEHLTATLEGVRSQIQEFRQQTQGLEEELKVKQELLSKFGSYANELFLTELEQLKSRAASHPEQLDSQLEHEAQLNEQMTELATLLQHKQSQVKGATDGLNCITDRLTQLNYYLEAFSMPVAAASDVENPQAKILELNQKLHESLQKEQELSQQLIALKQELEHHPILSTKEAQTVQVDEKDSFQAEIDTLHAEVERLKTELAAIQQPVELDAKLFFGDETEFPEDLPVVETHPEDISSAIFQQFEKMSKTLSSLKEEPSTPRADKSKPALQPVRDILIYAENMPFVTEWNEQISSYLHEFNLTHRWLDRKALKNNGDLKGKGFVFLLHATEAIPQDLQELVKQSNIPSIKHYVSNVTRLKIDIFDSFIR